MWNGTMFVDLDWPLNASSLLSASAELLVSHNNEHIGNFSIPKIPGLRVFNPGISGLAKLAGIRDLQSPSGMIWLYTVRYHIIIFYRFWWSLSVPRAVCTDYPDRPILCIIRFVRKCNNVRDLYELPDFWPLNSPDLNTFHYKIWGNESTRQSAGCESFDTVPAVTDSQPPSHVAVRS